MGDGLCFQDLPRTIFSRNEAAPAVAGRGCWLLRCSVALTDVAQTFALENAQSLPGFAEGRSAAQGDISSFAVDAHARSTGQLHQTEQRFGGVGISGDADDLLVELASDGVDDHVHGSDDHGKTFLTKWW